MEEFLSNILYLMFNSSRTLTHIFRFFFNSNVANKKQNIYHSIFNFFFILLLFV